MPPNVNRRRDLREICIYLYKANKTRFSAGTTRSGANNRSLARHCARVSSLKLHGLRGGGGGDGYLSRPRARVGERGFGKLEVHSDIYIRSVYIVD